MGARSRRCEPVSWLKSAQCADCSPSVPARHLHERCSCLPSRCLTSFILPIGLHTGRHAIYVGIFSNIPLLLRCNLLSRNALSPCISTRKCKGGFGVAYSTICNAYGHSIFIYWSMNFWPINAAKIFKVLPWAPKYPPNKVKIWTVRCSGY